MKIAKMTMACIGAFLMLTAAGSHAAGPVPGSNLAATGGEAAAPGDQILGSPSGVPFQGFLTDAAGNPLGVPAPVVVNVTFRIYDAAAGGTLLHNEAQAVSVSQGVFQANLTPPDDVFNGLPRYLALSVNAGPELTPRTEILSTPYARVSRTLSGFGEVDGQLQEGGGFTELVNSTTDQTMRRYYLTSTAGSDWNGKEGRVIIAMGGQGHPGTGTVTVLHDGATVATFVEPAAGIRPWTYVAQIPGLNNGDTIDVLARANVAGAPAAIRSITLETASVEVPGPPVVAFHAYNSASDASLPIGWNRVEQDVEVFDVGSNYNNSTDLFTAPVDGIYFFQHLVTMNAVADGDRYAMEFWVNGVQGSNPYTDSGYTHTASSFQSFGGSATLSLNAGDTVESRAFYVAGGHTHYGSPLYTWFSGQLLTATTTPTTRPSIELMSDPEDETR